MTQLLFDALPSTLSGYKNLWTQRGVRAPKGQVSALAKRVRIDRKNLRDFCAICGFTTHDVLPAPYLHVLAAPLHLQVMAHPSFPFKVLGVVHVRNTITQHASIDPSDLIDIQVDMGEQRWVRRGTEFDLVTQVLRNGECVWEEVTTILAPKERPSVEDAQDLRQAPKPPKTPIHTGANLDQSVSWDLSTTLGIRYGRVCGDFNPIHLTPISARLFGFKRHIAHGMWTASRTHASLTDLLPSTQKVIQQVKFLRPLPLPSTVHMHTWSDERARHVQVFSRGQKKLYIEMTYPH